METQQSRILPISAIAVGYVIVNWVSVFDPYVPSMGHFIAWGFVLPIVFLFGSWIAAAGKRKSCKTWWVPGLIATVVYASMGFFSVYIISAMWAAV